MKVVVVTGELMKERVEAIAEKHGHTVYVAPVNIAAFIRTEHLTEINGYDLILAPGYSKTDLSVVETATGIPTAKGPNDVANLSLVLENLDSLKLSKTIPACVLLRTKLAQKAIADVKSVDSVNIKKKLLQKPGNISIGGIGVGRDFPMRVIAEIVDADKKSDNEVREQARYYINKGADIIDLGISEKNPSRVIELIKLLREFDIPLSIDTMDYSNLMAALDAKPDLILSLDRELIEKISQTDIPIVVIPGKKRLETAKEKISVLQGNLNLAKRYGFKNLIADPILEPINYGLSDSITAYRELGRKSDVPMLMGVGNVTELTDADSIGMNAAFAGIAMECGVSMLFTTEASDKTRGSVKELKTASYMMYLSKIRQSTPKDLGIDLLFFKEKIKLENKSITKVKKVAAKKTSSTRDILGDFTIIVDKKIVAVHSKDGVADIAIEGEKAMEICDSALSLGLVEDLSHALYLGRELEKAEIALQTGRSYVQDEQVF